MTRDEMSELAEELKKCSDSTRELLEEIYQNVERALLCLVEQEQSRFCAAFNEIMNNIHDDLPEMLYSLSERIGMATMEMVYASPDVMCLDVGDKASERSRKQYPLNMI